MMLLVVWHALVQWESGNSQGLGHWVFNGKQCEPYEQLLVVLNEEGHLNKALVT